MTPLVLGLLALLLAGPVPALMARVPLLRRTPRAAMVLWQSVALAAVLAALGAGLSLTTSNALGGDHGAWAWVVAAVALALTVLVLGRLLLSGHRIGTDLRALRRRHRDQVDLLGSIDAAGVRVLEHEVPLAYCLPGRRTSRVVVSAGALGLLTGDEVDAVLAHERAHLRARHDLVLEAFDVLHRAFPRWVSSRAALFEVRLLVEVLADAAATRATGRRPLGRALVALAEARPPALDGGVTLAASGATSDLLLRVELLRDPGPHRLQSVLLLALAVLVLVLPTAFVVAPWLSGLA